MHRAGAEHTKRPLRAKSNGQRRYFFFAFFAPFFAFFAAFFAFLAAMIFFTFLRLGGSLLLPTGSL